MRRRALLVASQMKGGETSEEWDYYTVIPEEDCEVQMIPFAGTNDIFGFDMEYECIPFSYRINGGNWVDVSLGTTDNPVHTISVKSNDKIQVKCYGANFDHSTYSSDTYFIRINPSCKFKVGGTPMSLLYGDDFKENNVALGGRFDYFLGGSMVTEILNPESFLPYTILESYTYISMFEGCSELINAPVLPAKVLTQSCYFRMFSNCAKINYIKMLATDISAAYCLENWVYGVSSTGTFVKHPEATWDVRGSSGVPNGWTIKFDGEESGGGLINFTIDGTSYQAEEGMTWEEWVNSSYNTEGFIIDFAGLINIGWKFIGTEEDYVSLSDIILEDYQYLLIV